MSLNAPSWWYSEARVIPGVLSPLSYLYGQVVQYRLRNSNPYVSKLPVICVGNYTMGGAGKTPTALFLAGLLKDMGEVPVFLSRGYGGRTKGPHLVSIESDQSIDVGDEPLLLARCAPTVVSANRAEGALFIERFDHNKPTVIIMDDGFQNPSLIKSFSIIVVDASIGVGNGKVFPAGPLREPLATQLGRTDFTIAVETSDNVKGVNGIEPDLTACLEPVCDEGEWKGKQVLAYSGIARPEKFYHTLRQLDADVQQRVDFPDHYQFDEKDAEKLLRLSEEKDIVPVTTEKDIVRLAGKGGVIAELREQSQVLPVRLSLTDEGKTLLKVSLARIFQRKG